jgi:membrane protease YdiL (CAAX protease family)
VFRSLSRTGELILINLLCFGPFALRSAFELIERKTTIVFDDHRALSLVGIELVCGALAALILRARGWKLSDFGLTITMPQTIFGMLLLIGSVITISGFSYVVAAITNTNPDGATSFEAKLTWPVLIALTLINPLYDEMLVVAYNIRAAEPSGAAFAITLSATIRFICHLEQGPITATTILPLGIIFAAVYWRWRQVWPLIVAHGVLDFLGMTPGPR